MIYTHQDTLLNLQEKLHNLIFNWTLKMLREVGELGKRKWDFFSKVRIQLWEIIRYLTP